MTARARIHLALLAIAVYTVFFLPPHAFGETASEIRQQIKESGLGETIRRLNEAEARSLALTLLSTDGFASLWNDMDETRRIQGAMKTDLERLSVEKSSLADTKDATEKKRAELLVQQRNLVAQQGALDATRRAQADLLAPTKSQESSYQALLLEKQ